MPSNTRGRHIATLSLALGICAPVSALAAEEPRLLPEVTVTATREAQSLNETPAAVGIIPNATIERTRPNHPSQVMGQVPGVAVAVTNGEGHTTAIRQPFTTNPVYLFLEDGIPIRSTGFFNHNAIADRRYADSAQLSNNQPVLSPALPRTYYAGLEAKW